ncbi:MAG TPA: hypothetical protein ENL09_06890 [Bacteroidetes bacterium]|nr:hypothetical protein [Bacteroidota bacterium]
MNFYVVVEGISEKPIYKHWIPLVNPELSSVDSISDIDEDNFFIVSGGGYPNYFNIIENAIQDVENNPSIDRLIIGVDSEDFTKDEKERELIKFVESHKTKSIDYKIIVQHFCVETWALGNVAIVRRNPHNSELRDFLKIHNVKDSDPENLPANPMLKLNRAQFAELYLRKLLNEKHRSLTYNKRNPRPLLHVSYFTRLQDRVESTGHISSFNDFLQAFD